MSHSVSSAASNPAQIYEDFYVPCIFRNWATELLKRAQPQPGERVLDVACGTGIVARSVTAQLNGNVTVAAVDFSPSMLEVARAVSAREQVNIEYTEGNAQELPFPDASFDLVLVQQGLQFFGDKVKAVQELHRVLAPGGRAACSTWASLDKNPFNRELALRIRKHLGITEPPMAFSFGDPDAIKALFTEVGFTQVEVEAVAGEARYPSPDQFCELSVASASVAVPELRDLDAAGRSALVEAIQHDLAGVIQQYTAGGVLVTPQEARIVVAHKGA